MKLGSISLGCAKNLIDSELFLGLAKKYNLEITNKIKDADIIVVNTCGFILPAKEESLNTIFEVLRFLSDKNIPVLKVEREEPTLESLFMEVTGK